MSLSIIPPIRLLVQTFLAFTLVLTAQCLGAPTITVISPTPGDTVGSLTTLSVTFSEPVSGVDADDLVINTDPAQNVTGSGAGPYVFTFTQPPPGTVQLTWDFDHGIAGLGTGAFAPTGPWNYTLTDTLAPTIGKISTSVAGQELDALTPTPGSTVGNLTQVIVFFSEEVTGVDAGDLLLNGAPATALTGAGAGPYTFTVAQPAAGPVNFTWAPGHGIADLAGNPFAGSGWSVTLSASGPGNLVINEFLAANALGLTDENLENEDWIEIRNNGPDPVNLLGWSLSVERDPLDQWVFPSRTLAAGSQIVVFASGKNRKPASGNLHTNFKLNEGGGYLALCPPSAPRAALSQFGDALTDYPPQRYDFSYGRQTSDGALLYFSPPSPSVANPSSSALTSITPKPDASVGRGFFKDPFQLILTCTDPTATIRYTVNGTVPTTASTAYFGPIPISGTTVLRAVAFGASAIPSDTVTHSYIYLDQVLDQPSPPYDNPANANDNTNPPLPTVSGVPVASSGTQFPVSWGSNSLFTTANTFPPPMVNNLSAGQIPADYGMDTEVTGDATKRNAAGAVDNVSGLTNLERIKAGLRELPILSVVMKNDDMFGPGGIYPNASDSNKADMTKPCSLELLLPDGSTGFAVGAGIDLHGNASRNPGKNPKHGFTLKFKGDYGGGKLDYKLYPDSPVRQFDKLVLRADFNTSWLHWDGGTQRPKGTRMRDAYCKDTFRDMGRMAGHHRYTHCFINGIYWGTYDIAEDQSDDFAASYFGGSKADYDIVEQGVLKAGTITAYNSMLAIVSPIDNPKYELMKTYLDLPEFIDYMLLHFYVGHEDWGADINKNWYAARNRNNGKFRYLPWDMENLLFSESVNQTGVTAPPSGLHTKLVTNNEYKLDFADAVHRHMIAPDGQLLPSASLARLAKWTGLVNADIIACESARWGDYRKDVHQYSSGAYVLNTWNGTWITEINRLKNTYFPVRTNNVLSQLRGRGLYPTLNGPELRNNASNTLLASQQVPAGFQLKMQLVATPPTGTTSAGTIYYTTDDSDPRVAYSGTVNTPSALIYSTPLTLNASTVVKARCLNGTTWSALNETTFTVGSVQSPVRITEIMYNPPAANGGNAAEFVELQNTGTLRVDLGGYSFDGIDFIFPNGYELGPQARIVIASNNAPATFAAQYPGVTVAGYFGGTLENNGERLALIDASGRTVESVDYDDVPPWPTVPDGFGSSLERLDPLGDPDDPLNWRASAVSKGSPGQANSSPPVENVELSELLVSGSAGTGFVELRNKTASPVDISGWQIQTLAGTEAIPAATSLPASGFYALPIAGLPSNAGIIRVFTSPGLTTQIDALRWGNQVSGYSVGRVGGTWQLCTPTPGAANTAAATAPVTSIAINEWLANSGPGEIDWLELYNKNTQLPVALRGVIVKTGTQLDQIDALAFIPPAGFLQLFCNEQPGVNQLDFNLPASGTILSLQDQTGTAFDTVTYGAQAESVTQGRLPDGTGVVTAFSGSASRGAANYVTPSSGPILNEVLAYNTGSDRAPWGTPAPWIELINPQATALDLSSFRVGRGSFATAWQFAAGITMPGSSYLALWCDGTRAPSNSTSANLNTGFDLLRSDDAIFVYNPAGQIVSQLRWGPQAPDRSIGVFAGTWQLLSAPTRGFANAQPAILGSVAGLRINEWSSATIPDWFELYNMDPNPVALTGLYMSDDPSEVGRKKYLIPPLSFIGASGWSVFTADGSSSLGASHTNFSLTGTGEYLRLSANDATATVIDAVSFGAQAPVSTAGRVADGSPNISEALVPTPGSRNVIVATTVPVITSQSRSATIPQGATINLSVSAVGPGLSYEWRRNNIPVPGGTSALLTLANINVGDAGSYHCVVSNPNGADTSQPMVLTVIRSFAQWCAAFGIPGATATDDDDHDGLSNLTEFLHDLNPASAANAADRSALPQVGVEPATGAPTYLTLTYRRNASLSISDIGYQLSPALGAAQWTSRQPDVIENLSPDPVTGDPRVRLKFLVTPGETNKFIRLELTP